LQICALFGEDLRLKRPKSWTVLLYIAADVPMRDMRKAALDSLEQMRTVGSGSCVDLAAQADLTGEPTRRYYFPKQPDSNYTTIDTCIHETVRNVNSGGKQALRDFLVWGTRHYPARKYMVVCSGHAYGLDDYNPFPQSPPGRLRLHGEIDKRAPVINSFVIPGAAGDRIQAIRPDITSSMPDFSSRSLLSNRDVGEVLREIQSSLPEGQQLEILGMDACNMALVEAWYEMLDGPSIVVGSEYDIPVSSWPYDRILEPLNAKPMMTPSELAAVTVQRYAEYYSQAATRSRVTLSACDLRHANALAGHMANLVRTMRSKMNDATFRQVVYSVRNRTLELGTFGLIDLHHFCELLKSAVSDPDVAHAAESVMQSVDRFAFANESRPYGSKISRARGLAIYFPPWLEAPDFRSSTQRQALEYLRGPYRELKFVQETGWGDLLLKNAGTFERVRRQGIVRR
jgi:hypothetical protein